VGNIIFANNHLSQLPLTSVSIGQGNKTMSSPHYFFKTVTTWVPAEFISKYILARLTGYFLLVYLSHKQLLQTLNLIHMTL